MSAPQPDLEEPEIAAATAPEMPVAVVPTVLAAAARKKAPAPVEPKRPKVIEPKLEIVPDTAPSIEAVVIDDEDSWIPVNFEDVCDTPLSTPDKVWELTAALVAKLDEMTDTTDAKQTSPVTTVRVLAY